jgi:lipopolysaccharide transport system permease protein
MLVFTIIFWSHRQSAVGRALCADGVRGILPWTFFSSGLSEASNNLINNKRLISNVYFPRLIGPVAIIVVAFVGFVINFGILFVLMDWYRFAPDWRILILPIFVSWAFFALNVKYRDFRYVTPFIVQFGLYVSPVGFSFKPGTRAMAVTLFAQSQWWGNRWCILRGQSELYLPDLLASVAVTAFFLWFGVHQFRRTERNFADFI